MSVTAYFPEGFAMGAGRGTALIFSVSALSLWISSSYAFVNPRIRNLEEEIPDVIPDEPEEVAAVLEEKAQPALQTSSG